MSQSIFTIKLDTDNYNLLVINDLMRMFVIQFVVQILFFLRNDKIELFSTIFIENTLFTLLGLLVYWLVFNNIILFTNKKIDDSSISNQFYQNVYSLKKDNI